MCIRDSCDSARFNRAPLARFNYRVFHNACELKKLNLDNLSTGGAEHFLWEVEGGIPSSSSEENPEILLPTAGEYVIKLTVSGDYGSHVHFETYTVEECDFEGIVYPNPTDGSVFLDMGIIPKEATVRILSSTGILLWEESFNDEMGLREPLEMDYVKNLPAGIYFLIIVTRGESYIEKLEIVR